MSGTFAERFGGQDVAELEARAASGGMTPPGFYRAKLTGAKSITSNAKGTPGHELTFQITDGPFKGSEVTDTLWDTDNRRSQDRISLFCLRLGVLKRSADGKKIVAVDGVQDFMDVLDKPCIIETTVEEYERDNGSKGHSVRLAFSGCYYPDDKEAIAKIGKPVGEKSGTGTGTAAKSGTSAKSETKSAAKDAGTGTGGSGTSAKSKVDTSQL